MKFIASKNKASDQPAMSNFIFSLFEVCIAVLHAFWLSEEIAGAALKDTRRLSRQPAVEQKGLAGGGGTPTCSEVKTSPPYTNTYCAVNTTVDIDSVLLREQ